MKKYLLLALVTGVNLVSFAQRDLTPSKRRQVFWEPDFRNLRPYGFQATLGPAFLLSKKKNEVFTSPADAERPYNYHFDPSSLLGVYGEFGMIHFPKKELKDVKLKLFGHRIISYYDWGLGFKYLGGYETTTINYLNNQGGIDNTMKGEGRFYNGYAFGRFTVHHNFPINDKFLIDNGLGLNFDYRVMDGNREYKEPSFPQTQYFHKTFVSQLHYNLALCIRLKKGSYLFPGIQIPIMGFYEWNGGSPKLKWYSSSYRPLLVQVKYAWLLQVRKKNGCSKVGTKEAEEQNKKYMQGN